MGNPFRPGENPMGPSPAPIQSYSLFGTTNIARFAPSNPTGTASLTNVMMGLGSAVVFTPLFRGRMRVTFTGIIQNSTASNGAKINPPRWGIGTAPVNGAAATGNGTFGQTTVIFVNNANTTNEVVPW